jgi:hypothetical protein
MKIPSLGGALKVTLFSFAVSMSLSAFAQSTIRQASEPYIVKPAIRFLIEGKVAPSVAALPRLVVIAEPIAQAAVNAAATSEASLLDLAAHESSPVTTPINANLKLEKDKRVDVQFLTYGKQNGWDVDWQAPEFILDKDLVIPGDFESALVFFLKGANEAGSRLRAVFYRGNKTVRVMEF